MPLLPFLIGFGLAVLFLTAACRMFPRWGLLDFPERYGLKRARLPYPAGIAAVAAFVAAFGALHAWDARTLGILAAVALLGTFTFLDDREPLPALPRLLLQLGLGALIFATGDCTGGRICSLTNPLAGIAGGDVLVLHEPYWILSLAATIAWILLTVNALNWLDGIPGQVSVLSCIGFLTIGCLSLFRLGEPDTAGVAFLLCGIAAACAIVDFPPARAILGDTGAMFFGLMLGVLTIYSGGKVATAFLVLGVPIVDSLIVIARRLTKRKSPLKGSRGGEHLHHRLLQKGWHPRAVIALTAGIGTAFGVTALFLDTQGKFVAAALLTVLMLALARYSRTEPGKAKAIPV